MIKSGLPVACSSYTMHILVIRVPIIMILHPWDYVMNEFLLLSSEVLEGRLCLVLVIILSQAQKKHKV